MLVRRITTVALTLATLAASGCSYHSRSAQVDDVGAPALTAPTYKIVGNVTGTGTASAISPSVTSFISGVTVAEQAKINAVGAAIYDNDEVDMIIAPKVDAEGMDFGVFAQAKVTIKGKGVALTGPK